MNHMSRRRDVEHRKKRELHATKYKWTPYFCSPAWSHHCRLETYRAPDGLAEFTSNRHISSRVPPMVLASSRQSVICLATTISIVIVLSCFGEIGRQPRQHEHVAAWTSGRWLGQEKPRGAQDDSADDDPSLTSQKVTKNGNEVEKE